MDADRPLRKDAELNRQRLLVAATEVFAERGLDATLNDVAHYAGVGVGTAYRRFANKEQLIDELFAQRIDENPALADRELADADADAWRGFTSFIEGSLQRQLDDRGFREILNNPENGHTRLADARERVTPLVESIVERAKRAGVLRPAFDPTDLIFIQLALAALMDPTRDSSPALYRRYLTMFLDGVRAERANRSELPVGPLSVDQTQNAMAASPARPDQRRRSAG